MVSKDNLQEGNTVQICLLLQEVVPRLCTEAGTHLTPGATGEVATQEAVAGQLPPAAGLVAAPPASPLRAEVSHLCVSHSLHLQFS